MKPFTGVHFYRHGEKPAEGKEDTLAIVQVGRGPAHYVVQVGTTYPGSRIVPSCHPGWGAVSDLGGFRGQFC